MQKITWIKIYMLYWARLIHTELRDRVKVKPECRNEREVRSSFKISPPVFRDIGSL